MRLQPLALLGALCAATLTLSACGPVYSTHYRFTPPNEANGRQCVTQCAQTRDMCRMMEETRATQEQTQCQQNANMRYTLCLANAKTDQARSQCNANSYCPRNVYTERCEESYRQCFQNCGGRVESYQVCDYGCN